MTAPESVAVVPYAESEGASLIRLAIEKNLDVDKLERLVALKERAEERRAAQEFSEAMAEFQRRCPAIKRGKLVDYVTKSGVKVKFRHPELKDIREEIGPICADLGLSHTFDFALDGKLSKTSCTVWHKAGHSRTVSFTMPWETPNPMSDTDKVCGSSTRGQRQALILAFGLVTEDPDPEDVGGGEYERITDQQAGDLTALAEEAGVKVARICRAEGIERLADLPAARYHYYVTELQKKRDAPKEGK